MTLQTSGSMTTQQIKDELRQPVGNLTFPDPTTRWLSEKPSGSLVLPTDFYNKIAVKQVDFISIPGPISSFTSPINFGIDYPGRSIILVPVAIKNSSDPSINFNTFTVNSGSVPTLVDSRRYWDGVGSSGLQGIGMVQPTGTSGTTSITFSTTVDNAFIWVFSASNMGNTDFSSDGNGAGSGLTSLSLFSVSVPSNGLFMIVGLKSNSSVYSMVGANKIIDVGTGSFRITIGYTNRLPTEVNRPAGLSWTGASGAVISAAGFGL